MVGNYVVVQFQSGDGLLLRQLPVFSFELCWFTWQSSTKILDSAFSPDLNFVWSGVTLAALDSVRFEQLC